MRVEMGNYFHFSRVNSELQPAPMLKRLFDVQKAKEFHEFMKVVVVLPFFSV